jgi:hypothetical protein
LPEGQVLSPKNRLAVNLFVCDAWMQLDGVTKLFSTAREPARRQADISCKMLAVFPKGAFARFHLTLKRLVLGSALLLPRKCEAGYLQVGTDHDDCYPTSADVQYDCRNG